MNLFKLVNKSRYDRKKMLLRLVVNLLLLFLVIILILDNTFYNQIVKFVKFFSG